MIKKQTLYKLISERVQKELNPRMEELGFKYFKSTKLYKKKIGSLEYQLLVNTENTKLEIDEEYKEPRITFTLLGVVVYTEYEKWYRDTFDVRPTTWVNTGTYLLYFIPTEEDFEDSSFYTPTRSQMFKSRVLESLKSNKDTRPTFNIIDFKEEPLNDLLDKLDKKSKPKYVFDKAERPLAYTFFMYYHGFQNIANDLIDKTYKYYLKEINEGSSRNRYIELFQKFISEVKLLDGRELRDPFSELVSIKKLKNEVRLNFLPDTKYSEYLRLEYKNAEIRQIAISPKGEVFLYATNMKVIKYHPDKSAVSYVDIPIKKGWYGLYNTICFRYDYTYNVLIANTLLIFENGKQVVLELPKIKERGNYKQNSQITDLKIIDSKIYVAYGNSILKYSLNGGYIDKKEINSQITKIDSFKNWIISKSTIYDLDCNLLFDYKVGKANDSHTISNNGEAIVFYGYSTKSQYYEFEGKQKTLWAHPTFKKGYKEILYSDVSHNFDLYKLSFSPDDSIMVGGGRHGKYVAWVRKSFKRIELIPSEEVIGLLKPVTWSSWKGDEHIEKKSRTEVIELNGENFLKNRSNGVGAIKFLNDGKYFAYDIPNSKLLTVWNIDFKNIYYDQTAGQVEFHGDNFLSERNKNEIVIFKKKKQKIGSRVL